MSPTPEEQLVIDFCAAWSKEDAVLLASFFAETGVYHEVPTKRYEGLEAVRGHLEEVAAMASVEIEILGIASDGPLVFTERVDVITFKASGRRVDLPVAGVAVVRDGMLHRWTDYYDLQTATGGP
jgi:limonene-1,2-epoxide hydrolase